MTSTFRTVTHGTLEWRGILIQVTLEKQRFVDHLQIETLEPFRAPLPITETGYRSHFIPKDMIEEAGGPEAYVAEWLDRAAVSKAWFEIEADVRQYALL
jgi:hypothetical protein